MIRLSRSLMFLGLLLLCGACAARQCPRGHRLDTLYFGRAIGSDSLVSESDWAAFVSEFVVPVFPAGFTVVDGKGQWSGDDGRMSREDVKILEVVHPCNHSTETALQEIISAYKARFKQNAVLWIATEVTREE